MGSVRLFWSSAVRLKTSNAAKILDKIVHGNSKRKPWYKDRNQPVPELFGQVRHGNQKVASRRVHVLNAVFHEKITDLLSSSEIDPTLPDHGFLVTKVKCVTDESAINVYWTADSNINELMGKLPQVAGKLRHALTQLQLCGHVPHINFILEKNFFKAVDVEELFAKADYGPDYVPTTHRKPILEALVEQNEKITKTNNVLGIDRDAIMNQIVRSMKHVKEKNVVQTAADVASFEERNVNFKKFLKQRASKIQSRKHQKLNPLYIEQSDDLEDENGCTWENDDYIEDERSIQ